MKVHPLVWLGGGVALVVLLAKREQQKTADQLVADARAELEPLRQPIRV